MNQNKRTVEKNRIQSILFDLDGTLIDTEPTAAQSVQECFKEWNVQMDPHDTSYVTGRTWESAFAYLFQKYALPVSEGVAQEILIERYRTLLKNKLCVVAGSVQAVQSLAPYYKLGLVSGSRKAEILWALEKLQIKHLFQIILGAEDYPRSKPQPDGYLKAQQSLGVRCDSCLVFEDSTVGIASALAAGMRVIAITSTNHFNQDQSLAHFKISDLSGISAEWIQNLSFD